MPRAKKLRTAKGSNYKEDDSALAPLYSKLLFYLVYRQTYAEAGLIVFTRGWLAVSLREVASSLYLT